VTTEDKNLGANKGTRVEVTGEEYTIVRKLFTNTLLSATGIENTGPLLVP